MSKVFLMGLPEDLGQLGDVGIPQTIATATQARALERRLMMPQPRAGDMPALSRMATAVDAGAGRITALGDQLVSLIDAGTRVKVATKAAKARVKAAVQTYKDPYPTPVTEPAWTDQELIPGLSNLHLLLIGGVLLGGVLLLRRS